MFLRMTTQWQWAGLGERAGLNYQSLEFLLKLYPVKNRVKLFEDLQILEMSALQALREGREENASRN